MVLCVSMIERALRQTIARGGCCGRLVNIGTPSDLLSRQADARDAPCR